MILEDMEADIFTMTEAGIDIEVEETGETFEENAVLKAGVKNADDIDYVLYKVSKMEGEFEENLAKFLKDNPKFLGQELEEHKATGAPVKTLSSTETGVKAILRAKHQNLFEE